MLLAKMKVLFFNLEVNLSNTTGYSCEMVTSSTFEFGYESYHIGFFQPLEDIEEYKFQKEYLVNIKFPSIDYKTYCEYEKNGRQILNFISVWGKKL